MNLRRIFNFSLFAMGFAPAGIFVPILIPIFFYILIFKRNAALHIKSVPFIIFTLAILFLIYAVFWLTAHEESAVHVFIYLSFAFLFFAITISSLTLKSDIFNSLISFSLGIFCSVFLTCVYSIFWKNKYIGLGEVFNPLFGEEPFLSPVWSNMLALASLMIMYLSENLRLKQTVILLGILMGLYLGGRTFFLVIILALILNKPLRSLFYIFIGILLLVPIFIAMPDYLEPLVAVFESKGVGSTRFLHWKYAFDNFIYYPFGGMTVNQDIEQIGSFHNIFIDIYCVGGFILLGLFFYYVIIVYFAVAKSFKYSIIFFLTLIVLMQDSILEGGVRLLLFFLFFSLAFIHLQAVNPSSQCGIRFSN